MEVNVVQVSACDFLSFQERTPLCAELVEKLNFLSFRGTLRAEESLLFYLHTKSRFRASLGMTK
jgi:hypothetical protein